MTKPNKRAIENRVLPLAVLTPHSRNYNRHGDSQINDLRESLRQFGQVRSIVVQSDKSGKRYTIVAGHGIAQAAQAEGYTELRADVIPHSWSETRVLAYLAADNELGKHADPDADQLAAIVREVMEKEGEALARLAAGEQAALDAILNAGNALSEAAETAGELVDKAAELQKKWNVARGDVWQIGKHRLMCGDSSDRENISLLMGDDVADLLLTDPPYGDLIIRDSKGRVGWGDPSKKLAPQKQKNYSGHYEGEGDFKIEPVLEASKDFYKRAVIWGGNYFTHVLPVRTSWLVWDKTAGGTSWFSDCELAWTDLPIPARLFHYAWQGMIRAGEREERLHPTQKPVALMEWVLSDLAKDAKLILELFSGSGTTLLACEQTGRVCRAMELSPAYASVALERLALLGLKPERIESVK